jgi:gliding motility-associated-like protein
LIAFNYHKVRKLIVRVHLQLLSGILFFCLNQIAANAQCPPNIDFEDGTLNGWTCYTGFTAAVNGQNQITLSPSGPVSDRHNLITPNSGLIDPYGNFPVNCPNGSGYSLKLGNSMGGGQAEGISYEFTIPSNKNEYSLIYHYAVVFEDPVHQIYEQPRMEVQIVNVSDGTVISCSSLTFIPFGNILPGFFQSGITSPDGTPIWCKDWSAMSINLDSLAGKTIRLFFKTADCTFRRHFGYAYIDVNSECSSEFIGATFCPDDSAVTVTAPFGYQKYNWFNSNFTQVIGTQQSIRFQPPPNAGTTIAVEVIPYNGYGCIDTLYARLIDTLTITAFAGADALFCGEDPVSLGANPKQGLVYSWSPPEGLSNPNISNPLASPAVATSYVLTVRNNGGGCLNMDTVRVNSSSVDSSLALIGKAVYCLGSGDSAVLQVKVADSIQWFKDDRIIAGANQTQYRVTQSGLYYATVFSKEGCILTTRQQEVFIDQAKPGITYPVEYAAIGLPYKLQARQFGETVLWSPPVHLDNASSVTPLFTSSTEQLYTITIETNTGCVTVDTQLVKTVKQPEIYVPTAFTPNSDGKNDVLVPVLMGIKELRYFRVYNRWGQLLFETRTLNKGWDGRLGNVDQLTGVVVWIAEAIGSDGRVYVRKGTTVLVR